MGDARGLTKRKNRDVLTPRLLMFQRFDQLSRVSSVLLKKIATSVQTTPESR
jgi:hypothetical protein